MFLRQRTRVDKANIWPQNFGNFELLYCLRVLLIKQSHFVGFVMRWHNWHQIWGQKFPLLTLVLLGKYKKFWCSKAKFGGICIITINTVWAASSEFVSLSIPSWQTLNAHAQPFRGARDLAFCLKVPHDSLLVWASSGGSGETARMRRLTWTFAARIGDKYQIHLTWPVCKCAC